MTAFTHKPVGPTIECTTKLGLVMTAQNVQIYHNPRCSKSRKTLEILRENGIEPEIRLYLENAPSVNEIEGLLERLDLDAGAIMRTGESEYAEYSLADSTLGDAKLIQAIHDHPRLLERPIVVRGSKAVIGRPPENVLLLVEG